MQQFKPIYKGCSQQMTLFQQSLRLLKCAIKLICLQILSHRMIRQGFSQQLYAQTLIFKPLRYGPEKRSFGLSFLVCFLSLGIVCISIRRECCKCQLPLAYATVTYCCPQNEPSDQVGQQKIGSAVPVHLETFIDTTFHEGAVEGSNDIQSDFYNILRHFKSSIACIYRQFLFSCKESGEGSRKSALQISKTGFVNTLQKTEAPPKLVQTQNARTTDSFDSYMQLLKMIEQFTNKTQGHSTICKTRTKIAIPEQKVDKGAQW